VQQHLGGDVVGESAQLLQCGRRQVPQVGHGDETGALQQLVAEAHVLGAVEASGRQLVVADCERLDRVAVRV